MVMAGRSVHLTTYLVDNPHTTPMAIIYLATLQPTLSNTYLVDNPHTAPMAIIYLAILQPTLSNTAGSGA